MKVEDDSNTLNNEKERKGENMAVLTKPINRVSVIQEKDTSSSCVN